MYERRNITKFCIFKQHILSQSCTKLISRNSIMKIKFFAINKKIIILIDSNVQL